MRFNDPCTNAIPRPDSERSESSCAVSARASNAANGPPSSEIESWKVLRSTESCTDMDVALGSLCWTTLVMTSAVARVRSSARSAGILSSVSRRWKAWRNERIESVSTSQHSSKICIRLRRSSGTHEGADIPERGNDIAAVRTHRYSAQPARDGREQRALGAPMFGPGSQCGGAGGSKRSSKRSVMAQLVFADNRFDRLDPVHSPPAHAVWAHQIGRRDRR